MVRRTLGMDDVFNFGKHKGQQVEDVIEDDPDWIYWAVSNGVVDFDEEVAELITRKGII